MRTLAPIFAILTLLASPVHAQERALKFGTEGAYPPFNNLTADGKLVGFDIDIGNALCAELKATCEWVVQDWDGMIPALQAGKFDAAVASMFITEERKTQVDFTQPYYRTPAAFLALKTSPLSGVSAGDLDGKTIGVQGSSVYANYVETLLPASKLKAYGAIEDMFADLASGRVDAVNDDLIVLQNFLASPEGSCCKLIGTVASVPEIHGEGAGIAVRKGDPLRGELDAAITAIRASGKFKEINDKYFDVDLSPNPG